MAKTKHEIETKIRELIETGKTDAEIVQEMDMFLDEADEKSSFEDDFKTTLKSKLLTALKDQDETAIKQVATDCADTLKEFSIINGLKESDNSKDKELFEACENVYTWLYDKAWVKQKGGWNIHDKKA